MTANCVVCLDLIHGSTHPQCNVSGHQVYEAEPHDTLVTVYNHLTMKTNNIITFLANSAGNCHWHSLAD